MSIYFDFRSINELTGDKFYRQQREFTLDELSQCDGSNGKPAYVAIEGIIYDVSREATEDNEAQFRVTAGQDLTEQLNSCNEIIDIINNAPKVGILKDDYNINIDFTRSMDRQFKQDTSKFTPDEWIRYISPVVNYALKETNQGMNLQGMNAQRSYQKFILMGVLVGTGKTPQEAINQVQEWQNTGESQILKGGTSSMGTPAMGTVGGPTGKTGTGMGTTGGPTGTAGTGMGTTSGTMTRRDRLYFE